MSTLEFEKTILEVEEKLKKLYQADSSDEHIKSEIIRLEEKLKNKTKEAYKKLSPMQKVSIARHESRPQTLDYIKNLISDFVPLSGDRLFGDDPAIIGGLGKFNGQTVMIIGHERGHTTAERLKHNFGMAKPEGYRKSIRLMKLAEKFNFPVITFIDTSGAYPGMEGEERGQGKAIADSMMTSLQLKVPIYTVVIGEGGSGGAIALGCANVILMLEYAIYSVISPEGCASILFKDSSKAPQAAGMLKLTAHDLKKFKLIDEIIPEPFGGAHRNKTEVIDAVGQALIRYMNLFQNKTSDYILKHRKEKFLKMTRLSE